MDDRILYLSDSDVVGLNLDLNVLRGAVEDVFKSKAKNRSWASDKTTIAIGPGHIFQAKPGILGEADLVGMKWFGLVPQKSKNGKSINSVILISDVHTGLLNAIVDANWITEKRTAAMSAIVARELARKDSSTIGFLGAGVQALGHLEAMSLVLPNLKRVLVFSRTPEGARKLADAAEALGLSAQVSDDPAEVVRQSDVLVSTVPEGAWHRELLEPSLVAPGAFVAAVDLARNWDNAKLREFDLLVTDDHQQTKSLFDVGRMGYGGPYEADLADVCSAGFHGRVNEGQRVLFNFSGHALADLAVASAVVQESIDRGIGTWLSK